MVQIGVIWFLLVQLEHNISIIISINDAYIFCPESCTSPERTEGQLLYISCRYKKGIDRVQAVG